MKEYLKLLENKRTSGVVEYLRKTPKTKAVTSRPKSENVAGMIAHVESHLNLKVN